MPGKGIYLYVPNFLGGLSYAVSVVLGKGIYIHMPGFLGGLSYTVCVWC